MGKTIHYSESTIALLQNHSCIKFINHNRLSFTYEFRLAMFDAWTVNPNAETLKKMIASQGIDVKLLGKEVVNNLQKRFKIHGKPSGARNKAFGTSVVAENRNEETNEELVKSGRFVYAKRGISFHPDFINELYSMYPERSIEKGIIDAGLSLDKIGHQLIYRLKRQFDSECPHKTVMNYSEDVMNELMTHPYVKRITKKRISLNNHFFNEATLLIDDHSMNEVLRIFCLDPTLLSVPTKNNLKSKLKQWKRLNLPNLHTTNETLLLKIQRNRYVAMKASIEKSFDSIRNIVPSLPKQKRKQLCQWVQSLPKDEMQQYTITTILKRLNISRSNYYYILKSETYGLQETQKNLQDEEDIARIREVIDYKGYSKGSRIVSAMTRGITGTHLGRNKVLRLMRKYGVKTDVRKANPAKRGTKQMLAQNTKPNILKRQFRLSRPLTTFCTDVTYLKYGLNHRAYFSAIKDVSSGRIMGGVVSDNNDTVLACDNIDQLCGSLSQEATLIHSDQGIVYLSSEYQNQVEGLGLTQSMSRRGNCWDNASLESFFGHFKDECNYRNCSTLKELQALINDYIDYYNHERPQWTRMKMTPVQFESYLLEMSDAEFAIYHQRELEKYEAMMAIAAKKAKQRFVDMTG